MIRQLRIRFITVAMVSIFFVLAVILGMINIMNYTEITSDADSVLRLLESNGGQLPELDEDFDWRTAGERYKSPELFFEIRFFSALLDAEGQIVSTQTDSITAVSEDQTRQYAQTAFKTNEEHGYIDDYRFLRYSQDDGERIIFLDCGRQLTGNRRLTVSCIWMMTAGMAAVFLLVLFFSGKVMKPVAESYEKQRRFITDAGHELKTPITVIGADAALLEMETGQSEWLSDIQLQTSKLTMLTGDLIELSRMEEPGCLQMQKFPISDVVREVCESFRGPILTGGHTLQVDVPEGVEYNGNEKSITRLISILMDNAVKYTGGNGEISVHLESSPKSIRLSFSNDTDNISPDTVKNMFERFYRADSARSTTGYGVGLSIAKATVEAHHGKITAASPDGHNLNIIIVLPQNSISPARI